VYFRLTQSCADVASAWPYVQRAAAAEAAVLLYVLQRKTGVRSRFSDANYSVTPLTLPNHATLKGSTLRAICRQADIGREDFLKCAGETLAQWPRSKGHDVIEARALGNGAVVTVRGDRVRLDQVGVSRAQGAARTSMNRRRPASR
jgi:hypothetical protein